MVSSNKGYLPYKVIFLQRSSFIKGCLSSSQVSLPNFKPVENSLLVIFGGVSQGSCGFARVSMVLLGFLGFLDLDRSLTKTGEELLWNVKLR